MMVRFARTRSHARTLLVTAALVGAVFLSWMPAYGGVVTSWSLQPPSGSTVGSVPVIVQGTTPLGPDGLVSSTTRLQVDGMLIPRESYTATTSQTRLYVYWKPTPALPDGLRTFRVEVSDSAGRLSFRQWSARIAQPPAASWVKPGAGEVITTGRPTVTLLLTDNTPGTTFTVSGAIRQDSATGPIRATFAGSGLAAGVVSLTCSSELPVGRYYLTASITDAAGNTRTLAGSTARLFETRAASPMSALETCDSCHEALKQAHPTPADTDCVVCHRGYDGAHQGTDDCDDCHWRGWHTNKGKTSVAVTSPCTSCHTASRVEVVQHTPSSVESSHISSCGSCHVESLVARHAVTPEGSLYPYQCDLCHASTDTAVVAAIVTGDTSCSACHGGPDSGHEAVHTLERTDGCVTCHDGASLTTVHMVGGDLTCDSCHESEDAEVVAAIAGNNLACSGCHVTAGVDYHPNMTAAHTSPVSTYETCSGCHHSWGSNPLRGHDITRHAGGCVTCHNPETDLTEKTALCSSCHITEGAGTPPEAYHLQIETLHTATSSASLDCARCHNADLRLVHTETTSCDTCHTGLCSECHTPHNAMGGSPLGVGAECARCHTTAGTDYHASFATKHTDGTLGASCQAAGCHAATLEEAHAAYVGAAGRYPQYTDTCALCHLNEDPLRVPTGATAACSSCHATADHSLQHEVTLASECAGCHTDNNLLPYHEVLGCAVCHESTTPAVVGAIAASDKRCEACHGATPHGDLTATHAATVTNGPVNVFSPDHEGEGAIIWDVPCTLCHTSTNLLTSHAGDCAACHAGTRPAESFTVWAGSCSQGACHPGLEHSGDYAHNSYSNCDTCHEQDWRVIYPTCEWCHTPTIAAPVTTTDARTTYTGAATVGFSTSNFAFTFYRLDGGLRVGATSLVVPPPAVGSQSHTVEYWSVSDGGLEELPHKTATFTVLADTQAPTTTSNAAASYIGPASITLTPTDNGSTPVSRTYWKLNGGPEQSGRTVTVPQPSSGTAEYSLEFWSVDASGNEELPHSIAEFTITADTIAPTGSILIAGGAQYVTTQYASLTLAASDSGGSGVHQMRFSNDNVNWGEWEGYAATKWMYLLSSGYGPKTVYVQFRDRAGNVSTYSDGAYYDAAAPLGSIAINGGAATADSAEVVITNSITDAHSGLAQMRFSNNNSTWSAWEPFAGTKAWTLVAGTGTRTVYAQFTDNAGNIRSVSDAITVAYNDAAPPTGSISINADAQYATSTAVSLTLAAVDTGGSALSQMQFSNDGVNWSAWEAYATSKAWTLAAGDGPKNVSVRFRDGSGNVSLVYSDAIDLDTTDPDGWIAIDAGAASTTDVEVDLALFANDVGAGVSQMQFSSDATVWSAWEEYTTARAWTLAEPDGIKTVFVRFRDAAGNESPVYSDDITLGTPETTPPTGSVLINGGDTSTATTQVTLSLAAQDTGGSGLADMRFSNDNSSWTNWEDFSATKAWTLPGGDGGKTVYVQYRDVAGNVSISYSDSITLSVPLATIRLVWGNSDTNGYIPIGESYAAWVIRSGGAAGPILATGRSDAGAGWNGVDDVVVTSQAEPYHVTIDWYDADWEDGGVTIHYPVYATGGETVILRY